MWIDRMRLKDKVAIITGASRGIGKAIAFAFAREGANVVVTGFRSPADDAAKAIKDFGVESLSFQLDVRDSKMIDKMISQVLKEFKKINILVNNAGAFIVARVIEMTESEWDYVMDVNAKGVFLCSKAVAKVMISQNMGGKIINISSTAGLVGHKYYSAYCSSKRAILAFTECLAEELAPYRINVNAICPGDVETDMLTEEIRKVAELRSVPEEQVREEKLRSIPLHKFAKPEDIASLAVFLASDESNHITGETIKVAGGK
ncbi:3-oxoacyl-ACP reductase FabG [Candidatus Bathyarchaeota archaeon]|nr:3-oxoacyl-ACP reductase FabG [Candidatus Bathyarchaeota archaeon]